MLIRHNETLSKHTSFKIGGPAFCWAEPVDAKEILDAIDIADKADKDFTIFGNGTNILAADEGFDGVVIRLGKPFDFCIKNEDGILKTGGALNLARLINHALEFSLSGCEFLSGIPGTIGGAIFMNAGVRDSESKQIYREMKDIILTVDVLDLKEKRFKTLAREEIDFRYRWSDLGGAIILGARIKLHNDRESNIIKKLDSFRKTREWMKDINYPSAGSVFKNPDKGFSAGRLIESCELKGKRIGGAEISKYHANFIVNTGEATSKDVLELIGLAQSKVKEKFNIHLEPEIKIVKRRTKDD